MSLRFCPIRTRCGKAACRRRLNCPALPPSGQTRWAMRCLAQSLDVQFIALFVCVKRAPLPTQRARVEPAVQQPQLHAAFGQLNIVRNEVTKKILRIQYAIKSHLANGCASQQCSWSRWLCGLISNNHTTPTLQRVTCEITWGLCRRVQTAKFQSAIVVNVLLEMVDKKAHGIQMLVLETADCTS